MRGPLPEQSMGTTTAHRGRREVLQVEQVVVKIGPSVNKVLCSSSGFYVRIGVGVNGEETSKRPEEKYQRRR